MKQNNRNSEYKNTIVAGVWQTKNGHFKTMPLDAVALEKLKGAELGGTILIRQRTAESIAAARNPETTPTAYIEIVSAAEVQKFEENKAKPKTNYL